MINTEKKDNAILLAMSTLPESKDEYGNKIYSVRKSDFIWKEDNGEEIIIEDCRSQLEPVVKLMIDKIHNKQIHNNKLIIIMLCTNDTTTNPRMVFCGDEKTEAMTAVDYFKKRINSYKNDNAKDVEIEFKQIAIQEENFVDCINNATNEIRGMYKKCESYGLNFWIDTHGGFRDVSLVCNGIVSLLRLENPKYVPNMILGVKYGGGKSEIVNQKNMFDIFRFVVGMEDFSKNGNADILLEYVNNEEDEVIKAMNCISNGIKECNPRQYKEGMERFVENINNLKERKDMLKIFNEYIKNDFSELIDEQGETGTISPIKIIKRCIEKELYQQALTLIESLMPEYMVEKKLVYFDESRRETVSNLRDKSYISDEHFIFEKCVYNHQYYFKSYVRDRSFIHYMRNNRINLCNDTFDIDNVNGMGDVQIMSNLDETKKCIAGIFMRMHKALKKCRNDINHCNEDRIEMRYIEAKMKKYIELAEQLVESLQ